MIGLVVFTAIIEVLSAPIEWLWPSWAGGNTHWHGTKERNVVSLTFDDGPDPEDTFVRCAAAHDSSRHSSPFSNSSQGARKAGDPSAGKVGYWP